MASTSREAAGRPGGGAGELVERERELATLAALLAEAADGQGRLALIEGPAGIGKSRLLAEARRRAAEDGGALVLSARGSQLELEFPFGVVRQLFEGVLADPEERERAFAGAAAPAQSVFGAPDDAGANGAGGDAGFAALHGLFWLALNLAADRPLVLVVDDLHWIDRASLRFVAYLVRRLEGVPILLATTLRSAEPGTDPGLLAEIVNDPATVSIHPGPLSEDAVAELVRDRLGGDADDRFCAACHETTGGNPLLLRQLLRALEADHVTPDAAHVEVVRDIGPRAVSRTVLLRLARLSPNAIAVARAIAVLGDGADLRSVSTLAQIDDWSVAEATGVLARAEILRSESPLGFVHPLVRDAVYHELPPGERELQHARAAELLRDAGASSEQVAAHLLAIPCRGERWISDVLQEAGRAAMRKGAADSAVAYLRRALEEPPPREQSAQLLLELGTTEELVSGPEAAEHLREAYDQLTEPQARAIAALALARALIFTAPAEQSLAVSRQAGEELPPELGDLRQAFQALELVSVFFGAIDRDQLPPVEEYLARREGDGAGAKMLAAITSLDWFVSGATVDECVPLALDALRDDVLIDADIGLLYVGAIVVLAMADRPEAMEAWERAMAVAHRRGSLFGISTVHLWRGFTVMRRGELTEAEESLRLAYDELEMWGHMSVGNTYTGAFLGAALLARGDVEGARRAMTRQGKPGETSDGLRLWRCTYVELLLAEGRAEEALAEVDELAKLLDYMTNPAWAPWRSLKAQVLDRLGRTEEALALGEDELGHARRWGANGVVGRSLRILGELKREDGVADLEEAVALLERSAARLEHARALAALGATLRRGRKPTEAREPLRRALELADVCGARGLADQVRSELYATGARPRTEALSGVGSLTASERRVVSLAAEGQSNRDIAQTLYVTPKTVEVHLSNSYRKLGVRSRRDLPAALAGAEL